MHWSTLLPPLLLNVAFTLADGQSVFTQASNDSLLWGPYRSNLYFGLRPRFAEGFLTSLTWGRTEDYNAPSSLRFTCEQNSGMEGYGWDVYDPRVGGIQTIRDKENGIDIETTLVKTDGGRSWAARIKGKVREDAPPGQGSEGNIKDGLITTVIFAVGLEDPTGSAEVLNAEDGDGLGVDGDVTIAGQTKDFSAFQITISDAEKNSHPMHNHNSYQYKPLWRSFVHSVTVPAEAVWRGKELIFGSIKSVVDDYVKQYTEENMPPPWQTFTVQNKPGSGNMHIIQKVFEGDFEFDVYFSSAPQMSPRREVLDQGIKDMVKNFDSKFESTFPQNAPFNAKKYEPFGKSLFSNLIGGIGYFHGDHLVDRSNAPEYDEDEEGFYHLTAEARERGLQQSEGPYELFTAVPSRPFFPRGFLWDEGFHLLPIIDFDPEIVMQVVSSWYENMMDEDGWIPREVILGAEARSKVPDEFQVQYPHYANPPTLFMALEALMERIESHGSKGGQDPDSPSQVDVQMLKTWLRQLYPLLQKNLVWYRKSQAGDLKNFERGEISNTKEGYRWRGRNSLHTLTSGLDDYPRAQPPHPGELHVDLISWIGMMTRGLHRVATYLDETDDAAKYAKQLAAIKANVEDLHWDAKNKMYCDVTVDAFEESAHVCHKGYISLFPFMTGLMDPDHKQLGAVLELIGDEEELWSPFGIRSLSKSDELYATGENYWRSPVWMNLNYLILENLLRIGEQPGPQQQQAAKLYASLRENLVDTVYNSWEKTGFAWEQYNPETGEGQRTQHFTGWTSLVVKMMAMPEKAELGKGTRRAHDEL